MYVHSLTMYSIAKSLLVSACVDGWMDVRMYVKIGDFNLKPRVILKD